MTDVQMEGEKVMRAEKGDGMVEDSTGETEEGGDDVNVVGGLLRSKI